MARSPGGCVKGSALGPPQGPTQTNIEAKNQQVREIIQPPMESGNAFLKEVERNLSQWDAEELRKQKLLHKRWVGRVWTPMQERVEEQMSNYSSEAKIRQSLYSHYIHHCNTKGFVFLETYNPKEYNPFLLKIKKPHYFKDNTSDVSDLLFLQSHERVKEKKPAYSCERECNCIRRPAKILPQNLPCLAPYSTSQADKLLQASATYRLYTSRKASVEDTTELKEPSRTDTIPYHITATLAPDGRCYQPGCWSSRTWHWHQPAS